MKTLFKTFILILAVSFASCNMFDGPEQKDFKTTTALSIFVKDGKVGVSSLVNENYNIYTEYWIDSAKTDLAGLTALLPAGNYFRTSVDRNYWASTVYRKTNGEAITYKFLRSYSLYPDNQLVYYKGDERLQMDTTALGAIHAIDAADAEVFTGFFGREKYYEAGSYLAPRVAFSWDGSGKITILPMPSNYFYFNGVSAVHKAGNDVYVAGKMDFPMYWKNKEVVRLHENYGEVNQIKVVGNDVYTVGFYNKKNSNSTNHTACYWINNTLVELEDSAIAYSIFIVGKDVYVAGATGRYDGEYQACYWKNGKKVMLK